MNRAARRALGKAPPRVRVTNRIDVVPMEHLETYFRHEIASEGNWRDGVSLTILQPAIDRGRAPDGWFETTLARMRETRRRKGTIPAVIDGRKNETIEIDVGLVDVTVFFQIQGGGPAVVPRTEAEANRLLEENLRHLDAVCAGALHDQMILASALHLHHSNGSLLFHIHNLIFGLRQEVRDDVDLLGPLDLNPLLWALAAGGPLSVIGGMKATAPVSSE